MDKINLINISHNSNIQQKGKNSVNNQNDKSISIRDIKQIVDYFYAINLTIALLNQIHKSTTPRGIFDIDGKLEKIKIDISNLKYD